MGAAVLLKSREAHGAVRLPAAQGKQPYAMGSGTTLAADLNLPTRPSIPQTQSDPTRIAREMHRSDSERVLSLALHAFAFLREHGVDQAFACVTGKEQLN